MTVEISRIDFADKIIVTSDDQVLPISDLFDERGRATDKPDRAIMCVAGAPGGWVTFKLKPFERHALQ